MKMDLKGKIELHRTLVDSNLAILQMKSETEKINSELNRIGAELDRLEKEINEMISRSQNPDENAGLPADKNGE